MQNRVIEYHSRFPPSGEKYLSRRNAKTKSRNTKQNVSKPNELTSLDATLSTTPSNTALEIINLAS